MTWKLRAQVRSAQRLCSGTWRDVRNVGVSESHARALRTRAIELRHRCVEPICQIQLDLMKRDVAFCAPGGIVVLFEFPLRGAGAA
jgi:hypothetical protein